MTEYGLGPNVKVFVGAAVTAIFLLVWPWSNHSVAKSLLEAYARTSEELLFRGFLIGELRRLFKNSRRKTVCPLRFRHMARSMSLGTCE
ncbi:MAG: hypothetical protein GX795_11805 [Firmicutes bacterium]|nr:hypothetical protein [Bacillota bacterium]